MFISRTHIAAAATVVALGSLTAVALGADGAEHMSTGAASATTTHTQVRTEVVRRTVHGRSHRSLRHRREIERFDDHGGRRRGRGGHDHGGPRRANARAEWNRAFCEGKTWLHFRAERGTP